MKHGDEVMQAEEDGSYLLFPADYSYQVKAAGYKTARGTFTLGEADTTVKVTMVPGIEWDGTVADGFAGGTARRRIPISSRTARSWPISPHRSPPAMPLPESM